MGWTRSVKIARGLLANRTFDTNVGSMTNMNFDTYPQPQNQLLVITNGTKVLFGDIEILNSGIWGNLPLATTVLFWAIEVKQDTLYKVELCCDIRKTGAYNAELTVYLRKYTDSTTYTDDYNINQNGVIPYQITFHYSNYSYPVDVYAFFAFTEYSGESYIYFGLSSNVFYTLPQTYTYYADGASVNYFDFMTLITGDIPAEETSPEFGDASKPDGGYNPDHPHGTFDFSSDEIPISPKPTLGVTSAGFINVYKIEINDLQDLGEKLFPHFLPAELLADPSNMNVTEMLAIFIKMAYGSLISPLGSSIEFADNLGVLDILMNGKLIDYILDCHVIPTSISGSTIAPLRIGYRTFSEYQLAKATEDYVDIDCGSLNIKECFGNFLDYNCKVEVFLPFVGFVPVSNEYWNNATIQVHYRFNIIDGSFQARLVATRDNDGKEGVLKNAVIGQYGGVCCVHFPITGLQYSNVVAGLVNGSTGAIAKGVSGNYAGVATDLMNMASLKPDSPMSNGYNASSSFLGQRIPYLVIKYPAPQFSTHYPNEIGLPLNVAYRLVDISGFTVVDNPVLNIQCSDEEYNEIVSLLKTGVIL